MVILLLSTPLIYHFFFLFDLWPSYFGFYTLKFLCSRYSTAKSKLTVFSIFVWLTKTAKNFLHCIDFIHYPDLANPNILQCNVKLCWFNQSSMQTKAKSDESQGKFNYVQCIVFILFFVSGSSKKLRLLLWQRHRGQTVGIRFSKLLSLLQAERKKKQLLFCVSFVQYTFQCMTIFISLALDLFNIL